MTTTKPEKKLDHEPNGATPNSAARPPRQLDLTDFLDLATLQEIQDSFAAVTRLLTCIHDADGARLTPPIDPQQRATSEKVLDQLLTADELGDETLVAPIIVEGQQLGSIQIEPGSSTPASGASQAAAIRFLYLLANAIARLCYDKYHARQRAEELEALYKISSVLSGQRDLQRVLDTAVASVAEVMAVHAASIRLATPVNDGVELAPRAVHNLPPEYLTKGVIRLDTSNMFDEAIGGKTIYVEDMAKDPRVLYPIDAQREQLVSMLCVGIVFQARPVGTIQLFSAQKRQFTEFEKQLLHAISQLLAAAIENARLDAQRNKSERIMRQVRLAADVQRRMLPESPPHVQPFDVAARCVPSMELGGDFYDLLELKSSLGMVIGDVSGKGVAAALLMASVRASLRAYAQDVYDLDEIIARVNTAMTQDTLDNEFVTLWYGVLDPVSMRLTYCNAGHEPPILLRHGEIRLLDTGGMLVGVDTKQHYAKGLLDLHADDFILLYSDGLTDAMDANRQKFGRDRVIQAMKAAASCSAQDALNAILSKMRHFTGQQRSFDDTTLVVTRVGEVATQ